jgi:hypothetical protein
VDAGRTGTAEVFRCGTPLTVLVEASAPPPRLIVFGAVDFTAALEGAADGGHVERKPSGSALDHEGTEHARSTTPGTSGQEISETKMSMNRRADLRISSSGSTA